MILIQELGKLEEDGNVNGEKIWLKEAYMQTFMLREKE